MGVPVGEEYMFPLSFQQTRLWLLEQLEPANPAYHVPIALRISGNWTCRRCGAR